MTEKRRVIKEIAKPAGEVSEEVMKKKICLYHATPSRNKDSILAEGLLTRETLEKLGKQTREYGEFGSEPAQSDCVFFGDSPDPLQLNIPSVLLMEEESLMVLEVCFEEESFQKFYPDDNYIDTEISAKLLQDEAWREKVGFDEWSSEKKEAWLQSQWKKSLEMGYGVCYKDNIPKEWITIKSIDESKILKNGKRK